MNELTLIPIPPYNLKRIWQKSCIVIAQIPLLPPCMRLIAIKWGGVKIKGKCFIGSNVQFDGIHPNLIEIGNGCIITTGTTILSHFYNTKDGRFYSGKVRIGENVFIGTNTIIVNAVDIGNGAVIGAGSVVNRDIPSYELWAGNPARFIKKLE